MANLRNRTGHRLPFILGLVLLSSACQMGGKGEDELEESLIRKVDQGDLVEEVVESGRIAPVYEVDIKSKVSGEVIEVLVDEGAVVEKGQELLHLDERDYRRQVRLAQVDVDEARLNLRNAELELQRNKAALDARGISQLEYDVAERNVELSQVRLSRTLVNHSTATDQLSYTKISAPMAGTVIYRNVDPGELITAGLSATVNGEAQLTIARIDKLVMELDLNQVDVAKVELEQRARILLDAYPGQEVEGTVTRIAAAGHTDSSKGIDVFEVRVELDPSTSDVDIKPGMTAEVRILVGKYPNVVKVPSETVFEQEGDTYIYIVKDDPENPGKKLKEKVKVEVGHRGTREIELSSGIKAGDEIYARADVKDMSMRPN